MKEGLDAFSVTPRCVPVDIPLFHVGLWGCYQSLCEVETLWCAVLLQLLMEWRSPGMVGNRKWPRSRVARMLYWFDYMALRGTIHTVIIVSLNMYYGHFMEMVVKCVKEDIPFSGLHKIMKACLKAESNTMATLGEFCLSAALWCWADPLINFVVCKMGIIVLHRPLGLKKLHMPRTEHRAWHTVNCQYTVVLISWSIHVSAHTDLFPVTLHSRLS